MLQFSTDDLPPHQRFDHWREVRARHLFGVSAELARERRPQFRGLFTVRPVADAAVVEMHASSYRVRRAAADIARAPSDSLCIYEQLDGGGWFDTGRDGDFVLAAGTLATSHSDLPYETEPTGERGFHLRLVKIPFARCRAWQARPGDLVARPVSAEPGIGVLLAVYFRAFMQQAPHLDGAAAAIAVETLAQLALAARGAVPLTEEPGRAALRTARLAAARRFIEAHLHRPALAPAGVAAALGISLRHLHLLFEPTGTSCARHILAGRLERARRLLIRDPGRPVADIAFACGFESLSTFHRGFRAVFGRTPAELRRSALEASDG